MPDRVTLLTHRDTLTDTHALYVSAVFTVKDFIVKRQKIRLDLLDLLSESVVFKDYSVK